MLAAMVIDMARPKPPHAVRAAMEHIIEQVVEHKTRDPRPPRPADVEQAVFVQSQQPCKDQPAGQRARDLTACAQRQRGERIFRLIFLWRFLSRPQHF